MTLSKITPFYLNYTQLEAPEQVYDPRSLYERLQEQKQRKELEYEEAHKLSECINKNSLR